MNGEHDDSMWWWRWQVNRAQTLNYKLHVSYLNDTTARAQALAHLNLINQIFTYALFPLGLFLNLVLMAYTVLSRKPFYAPTNALANICVLVLYLPNYIEKSPPPRPSDSVVVSTLSSYSPLMCKTQTFFFHLATGLASWMVVFLLSDIRTTLNPTPTKRHLSKFVSILFVLIPLFGVYSIDLVFIDMIKIIISDETTNEWEYSQLCVIKSPRILLVRDLLDFIATLLVPFGALSMQCYRIGEFLATSARLASRSASSKKKLNNALSKLAMIPFSFSLFILPSFVATFVNNLSFYAMGLSSHRHSSISDASGHAQLIFKYMFALSILLNQLRCSFLFFIISYYDKNLRKTMFNKNSHRRRRNKYNEKL